jgi:hypothetical protein
VRLNMLLQILGTLERFSTEITLVRLERNVHPDMRGDMVAFHSSSTTATPLTSQVEVVRALSANVTLADMFL